MGLGVAVLGVGALEKFFSETLVEVKSGLLTLPQKCNADLRFHKRFCSRFISVSILCCVYVCPVYGCAQCVCVVFEEGKYPQVCVCFTRELRVIVSGVASW